MGKLGKIVLAGLLLSVFLLCVVGPIVYAALGTLGLR